MTTSEVFSHLERGARLGDYRIRKWKGGGGYGDVYEGTADGRRVALKVSKHRVWSNDPDRTDDRLLRELVCLAHLDHPHIAKVHGWARTRDGRGYLALEYVDGWTLADWCQRARPTVQQVVRLFAKLAQALEHMHGRRVRHRDISPSNLMVRKVDGEPVIIDFGAGEYSGAPELTDGPLPPGTRRYRSPEALRFLKEHQDDPEARYAFPPEDDFYALAVCLYDALTDPEPTRHGDTRKAPRIDVNSPTRRPPSAREANPRVPEALGGWLEQWMAADPQARHAALASMREALEALGEREEAEWHVPVRPPEDAAPAAPPAAGRAPAVTRRRMLAGAVAAAMLAVSLFALPRGEAPPPSPPVPAVPESSRAPRSQPAPPPASPPAQPADAVPSPAPMPSLEKEKPAVSPPRNPPPGPPAARKQPQQPKPAASPRLLAKCAGALTLAAAQLGCPPQVLPTKDRCPTAAVEVMRAKDMPDGQDFSILVDVRQDDLPMPDCLAAGREFREGSCLSVLGDGAVEGLVIKRGWGRELPEGTRLFGRIWTGGTEVVGRYTRAITPSGEEFPVCIALGTPGDVGAEKEPGSRPGAARVRSWNSGTFIHGQWP